jgi:transcriptional regulator with XRE-family HTH domain
MTIGDNVRARRKASNMTQTELAERAGITQAVISRLEAGEENLKLSTLRGIAAALGCAVIDLLPDEDKRRLTRL